VSWDLKKISRAAFKGPSVTVAALLIVVVLLSAGSGLYAGASFFPQQAPNVTITTTTFTTVTSWTTSTIWSTVTSVVYGVWTTVQYTTSTSTVTVTGVATHRTAKIVTANGNARISTGQSEFGGASGFFDGATDYLATPDSADWNFGSGDFTVDWWFRASTVTSDDGMFQLNSRNANVLIVAIYSSRIYIQVSGGTSGNYGSTLTANTWHHFAVVRSGNTMTFYTDGSAIYSFNCAGRTYSNGGNPVWIGMYASGTHTFSGYLDEFRISNGIARWTSSFTPPTGAYANDANTVLLLHMDGADGSAAFIDDVTSG
jgi:preprotein translocase subunit SecG